MFAISINSFGIVEVFFQNGEGSIEQQGWLKVKQTLHKYQFSAKKIKLSYPVSVQLGL
jgi:hypothetical protein